MAVLSNFVAKMHGPHNAKHKVGSGISCVGIKSVDIQRNAELANIAFGVSNNSMYLHTINLFYDISSFDGNIVTKTTSMWHR